MNTKYSFFIRIDAVIRAALKYVTLAMFTILMLIVALNVLNRLIPVTSFHWLDEIIELCFASMTFYGAAAVWITKGHYSAGNWLEKRMKSDKGAYTVRLLVDLISLSFFTILLYYSASLMVKTKEVTAVFQIPRSVLYSCMPVSSLIMIIYSVYFMIEDFKTILPVNKK